MYMNQNEHEVTKNVIIDVDNLDIPDPAGDEPFSLAESIGLITIGTLATVLLPPIPYTCVFFILFFWVYLRGRRKLKELEGLFNPENKYEFSNYILRSPFIQLVGYASKQGSITKAIPQVRRGKTVTLNLKLSKLDTDIDVAINRSNVAFFEVLSDVGILLEQYVLTLIRSDMEELPTDQLFLDFLHIRDLMEELDAVLLNKGRLEFDLAILLELKSELEKSLDYHENHTLNPSSI